MLQDTIQQLLNLLAINGKDINRQHRASIIISLIQSLDTIYWGLIMRQSPQDLIAAALEKYKTWDNIKIVHSSDLYITMSWHEYHGSSGDWEEKESHHRFLMYHMVHGFKVHQLR